MTFAQIPSNEAVFTDANIFIYHFTPDPRFGPACQQLFEQITKYQQLPLTPRRMS